MKKNILDWKMNYREYKDIPCTVPCSMYSVMLENGYMEDPFFGLNEIDATKMSDYDTEFISNFIIEKQELENQYINLNFLGLDTLGEIWLNGKFLGKTKNMHRKYSFDVKDYLNPGENQIKIILSSPTEYFKRMSNNYTVHSIKETMKGSPYLRKTLCMSGWDWGPKLPDMGIFRPVELEFYNYGKIEDFFVRQYHKKNQVDLSVEVEVSGAYDDVYVNINNQKVKVENGQAEIKISNPKLWWPRGYGEQNLYDVEIELLKDGKIIDVVNKKIGLRTLTVSTIDDEGNEGEFCFVVNGVKIFAMGANYIPEDSIFPRITEEKIKKVIDAALFANYNCLRVWGGGYYPSEYFYDLCDEKGIIIWQDFMAACCEIRLTKEMLENIKEEAIYNLKRFRNHASFGMFCGNNEVEETYVAWEGVTTKLREFDYIELYEHILPDICREYIPETFYWPSSPHSKACLSDPSNYHKYEAHVWEVWGGNLPHECYRKHIVPFSSEYGFQSFPSVKTLKTVCSDKEMNMFSETMEHHQKSVGFGTGWKVMNYIARSYLYQTEFENIVYATQIEQAESIRIAVEHLRRNRGKCMGSLYWQINDCWPVISWSSVDYYGRYKALHYSAKKVYAPLLMVITDEKEKYTISISNEQMKEAEGTIKFGVYDNDFNEIETCSSKYSVSKLSAKDIATFDATKYLGRRDVYFAAECYDENGKLISRKIQLFVIPKHYGWKNPEISVRASDVDGGVIFKISAKYMAKSVFIDFNKYDVVLSDNNFDILAGGEIELFANTDIPVKELEKDIIIKSLNVLC